MMGDLQDHSTVSSTLRNGASGEKDRATISSKITKSDAQLDSEKTEVVQPNVQAGVLNIEAVTSVWTTTSLIIAYVMIWVIYFVMLMQQGALAAFTPFVTSAFQQHSLTPTVSVISSIIGGVFKLTLAKVLDVFGRPQGYLISIIIATLGLIMMAACNNVELYAAAQVFYTVGQNALLYSTSIFISDTSSLHNRALMFAFASSPNLITTWLSGPISEAFLGGPGWRWAFGVFSVIIPFVTLPLFGLLTYNFTKAKRQGIVPEREGQRTAWQSFVFYCREFDAIGLFLLSAGLALFLLPFNIYTMQSQGWRAPLIICLLVFGFILILAFLIWERLFAPVTFIPYMLLLDRTLFGSCVLSAVLFISYFCWFSFFSSFLMVVNDLSITEASYVSNIYGLGSTLWALIVGWWIRHTGYYKSVCLWFAIPLHILGMGLMINYREANSSIGLIIMCQVFISFAGGAIIVCTPIAAMAAASHQHVAVVMAAVAMFGEIGGAVGLTIAASIWQNVFPAKLVEYLPTEELPNLTLIYGDLTTQLIYPVGSTTRIAIQHAYGDAQKMMLIAGTAIWVVGFIATFAWRNLNVKNINQVKGRVI